MERDFDSLGHRFGSSLHVKKFQNRLTEVLFKSNWSLDSTPDEKYHNVEQKNHGQIKLFINS